MPSLRRFCALRSNQSCHDYLRSRLIASILLILVIALAQAISAGPQVMAQGAQGETPPVGTPAPPDNPAQIVLLIILSAIVIMALPAGYLLLSRMPRKTHSLLLVSTDEEARKLVIEAAKRAGYATVSVYRYEDALDKLREDFTLNMIVIDDSVPQYEAGLLVSMLMRLPMGIRPLILIHDSSEMGLTAPSYRAEVVVSRPLTIKVLEAAIRQVGEHVAIDL